MRQTIYHVILSALIFLLVDRIIRFVGTFRTNKFEIEHKRIQIELALVSTLSIFLLITMKMKNYKIVNFSI